MATRTKKKVKKPEFFTGLFARKVDNVLEKLQEDLEQARHTMARQNEEGFLAHLEGLIERAQKLKKMTEFQEKLVAPKQKTITRSELKRLEFSNSPKLPDHISYEGSRLYWTGISWINEGALKGDEVLLVEDDA